MSFAVGAHLQFDIDNKRYRVVCDTNFLTTYGLNPANTVAMYLLGTTYFDLEINQQHNTTGDPLIDLKSGAVVSAWFPLPEDTDGNIVPGSWTSDPFSVYIEVTNLQFTSVTPPNTIVSDGNGWLYDFLSPSDTITLEGGTPQDVVVASVTDGDPNVTIITSTVIAAETYDGIGFALEHTAGGAIASTYSSCNKITLALDNSYNCDYAVNGSLTSGDVADYLDQTLVSSTLRIKWPSWTQQDADPPADEVVTQAGRITKTVYRLATGRYTIFISNTMSYTQNDGLVVTYTVTNENGTNADVICASSFCCLIACFVKLKVAHIQELLANTVSKYQAAYDSALGSYLEAQEYRKCTETEKYLAAVAAFKATLDNSGACGDCGGGCDDENMWVYNTAPDTVTQIDAIQAALQYRLFNGIPGVNQDSSLGVQIGAVKQNFNSGIEYRCTDPTIGAAVWEEYYNPSNIGVPYKSYQANITQSGTDDPVAVIMYDNSDRTIELNRSGVGLYELNITAGDPFDPAKVLPFVTNNFGAGQVTIGYVNTTQLIMSTRNAAGTLADSIISSGASLEIRVYP